MKKKIIAAVLAAAVTASLPVFAANAAQETTVTVDISPVYVVTIPKSTTVPFNSLSTDFERVELSTAKLEPGKVVKVELETSGKLKNSKDESKTIAYAINKKNDSTAYTTELYETEGDNTPLKIDITQSAWNAAYGGSYSDVVTFNIAYVDAE